MRIPRRNKANTGGLSYNMSPIRAHDRHHGVHRYCVLCKKAVIPKRKHLSYNAKDCTGVRTKRTIKYGMGGPMGSRTNSVQQYRNSEENWKEELKAPKK